MMKDGEVFPGIQSLISMFAEMLTYAIVSELIRQQIKAFVFEAFGYEPEEEKEEAKGKIIKNSLANMIKDILSPVPSTDRSTLELTNKALKIDRPHSPFTGHDRRGPGVPAAWPT